MSGNDRNASLRAFFTSLSEIFAEAAAEETGEHKPTFQWMQRTADAAFRRLEGLAESGQRPQAIRLANTALKMLIAEANRAIPRDNLPARMVLSKLKLKKLNAYIRDYEASEEYKRAAVEGLRNTFNPPTGTEAKQPSWPEPEFNFHSPVLFSGEPSPKMIS